MTDIDTLIRDLEGATEGSRDLSDKALLGCGWIYTPNGYGPGKPCWGGGGLWTDPAGVGTAASDPRPSPTESLDAALTLVPEGEWWAVDGNCDDPIDCSAAVGRVGGEEKGRSVTPALALCIAALKARSAA